MAVDWAVAKDRFVASTQHDSDKGRDCDWKRLLYKTVGLGVGSKQRSVSPHYTEQQN